MRLYGCENSLKSSDSSFFRISNSKRRYFYNKFGHHLLSVAMLNLHLSLELSLLMEETLLHKVCFCYLVCNNFSISIFSQWLVETGKRGVAVVKNKIYLHLKHLHLSHVNCRYHTLNIQPACLL